MKVQIIISRFVLSVLLFGALTACYGTKVPPPQSSSVGPPGLGGISPGPGDFALPVELPELLLVYRQWLIDQNHHISPQLAQKYSDAEIQLLKEQYSGRDNALRTAIKNRIQLRTPNPSLRSKQIPANAYPADTAQDDRESK